MTLHLRRTPKLTPRRDRAATIGAYLHICTPPLIVAAALVLHALHNGVPPLTLVALVSAAYGRLAWHDFMQSRVTARPITESVADPGTRRDVTLGVEPTR